MKDLTPEERMLKFYQNEHENMRKKLWIDVAANTASADNCTDKKSIVAFSNYALNEFDKIFHQPYEL